MVDHFKDRVKWWEVWNEPSTARERYGFGPDRLGANLYARLIQAAAATIRAADPEAKILISNAYWPWEIFKQEVLAKVVNLIDAFELHIRVYESSLNSSAYKNLPERIRANQDEARSLGFKGIFMSEENQWFAEPNPSQWLPGKLKPTYIGQAKNLARLMLQNAALDVVSFWQGGFQLESGTLSPAYYVYRTLCTITDGAQPTRVEVNFSARTGADRYGFRLPDGRLLVALWLPGDAMDDHPGQVTDVTVRGVQAKRVLGIDVLNGDQQELNFTSQADGTVVPGVVLRDYPVVLQIQP